MIHGRGSVPQGCLGPSHGPLLPILVSQPTIPWIMIWSMIWYFSHKWWCDWSELVLSLAEYLQFSGTMIVSGFCRQSRQSRSTQMPLLRTLVFNNHLSKPDTKERLENHFKIFPHRPEETFGRFSKTIPCEASKKKMMYGCLMCHRTFKSSRNCYIGHI